MPKVSDLPAQSPDTITALRDVLGVTGSPPPAGTTLYLEKPSTGTSESSALDLRANDSQGNLVRLFTDGLDEPENPTAIFNAGAHFHTIASVLISGVPNGFSGESWDVVEPAAGRYSYMLGVWADTPGPTVIFRSNEYAGELSAPDAHPLMHMSGSGDVVQCVEDDGSISFGAGQLRTDMDLRVSRLRPGLLAIDTRPTGPLDENVADGALALKTVGCTLGGGVEIAEGTNARMGVATLVGGTVTVPTTQVAADSRIFLTSQEDGGTPGFLRVSGRTVGTSFTITSSSASDTSVVAWEIKQPYLIPEIPLGAELVNNGTFDTDIAGWQVYPSLGPSTLEWESGELHSINTAGRGLFGMDPSTQTFAVEAGKSYRVTGTVRCVSGKTHALAVVRASYGAPVFLMIDNNQNPGTYTFDEVLVSDYTGNVHFQADYQSYLGENYVDNLSVREVL